MARRAKHDLLPCPCCGGTKLYAEAASAQSVEIKCMACGIKVERSYPEFYPKAVWGNYDKDQDFWALRRRLAAWVVEKKLKPVWNRRAHEQSKR